MKKRLIFVVLALLIFFISLAFAFDWNKVTGFAIKNQKYNLTCVYYGTQLEGPIKNLIDPFSNITLSIYSSKTGRYSDIHSDKCVKKRVGKNYKEYVREVYCFQKDTRNGQRDEVRYDSRLTLCENGCLNGACIKPIPLIPSYCQKILDNGNSDNRVDIIFVADNYENQTKWTNDVNELLSDNDGFFSLEPMKSYKDKFNVWRIDNLSNQFVDLTYGYIMLDSERAVALAKTCVGSDSVLIIADYPNETGGMSLYPNGGFTFIESGNAENRHLSKKELLHEFGHGFAFLADEYENAGYVFNDPTTRPNIDLEGCPKWCSGQLNPNSVGYERYISFMECAKNITNNFTSNYLFGCDYPYESVDTDMGVNCKGGTGCYWNAKGITVFRSSANSIMRYAEIEPSEFNLISQEAILDKIRNLTTTN